MGCSTIIKNSPPLLFCRFRKKGGILKVKQSDWITENDPGEVGGSKKLGSYFLLKFSENGEGFN